jgi:uncharacterized membrane protein YgcG
MKRLLLAAAVAVACVPAHADVSVGASITIGDPNFYGVINIGEVPEPPRLIFREPRIIERVTVVHEPVYLHVPPGHAKKWDKHCHKYDACSRPVYFVDDDWYQNSYAPVVRAKHGKGGGGGHKHKSHGGGGGGGGHKHKGDKGGGHGKGGNGKGGGGKGKKD